MRLNSPRAHDLDWMPTSTAERLAALGPCIHDPCCSRSRPWPAIAPVFQGASRSATASPQGDITSVQPLFNWPSRSTPDGQAKA